MRHALSLLALVLLGCDRLAGLNEYGIATTSSSTASSASAGGGGSASSSSSVGSGGMAAGGEGGGAAGGAGGTCDVAGQWLTFGENIGDDYGVVTSDTYLVDFSGPHGTAEILSVDQGETKHALLRFDISELPACCDIVDGRLVLEVTAAGNSSTVHLYFPNEEWDESTATWTIRAGPNSWSIPGCNQPCSDASSIVLTVPDFAGSGSETALFPFVTRVGVVQKWAADGNANFGILLAGENAGTYVNFHSKESLADGKRPRFEVRCAE